MAHTLLLHAGMFWRRKKERAKRLSRLRQDWGKQREKRAVPGVGELLKRCPIDSENRYALDEQTWADLDMDYTYGVVDHTTTAPGAQYLWRLLHSPYLSHPSQDEQLLQRLSTEPRIREGLQMVLSNMGREEGYELPGLLWSELPVLRIPTWALHALSWLLPLTALLGFFLPAFWIAAAIIFFTNNLITFSHEKIIVPNLPALVALSKLLRVAGDLSKTEPGAIDETQQLLKKNLRTTPSISGKVALLLIDDPLSFVYAFNTIFLRNVIAFVSVATVIRRHKEEFREIYEAIGALDVAVSTASFRAYLGTYCQPQFHDEPRQIMTENIYHPCVLNAVANNLHLETSNLLVMGSNMSGKSTFLKTIGVNAILSQTLGTVAAARYEAPAFRVMTSIDILDNLEEGTSYYLAEVESTLRLVHAASRRGPYLFIVDEVFRGTNPAERVAAATAVLRFLGERHLVLASTHDSEIYQALIESYKIVHFREELSDKGFVFDHKVRQGPSRSRNAIALLEHSGYPSEIVMAAQTLLASGDN